MPLTIWLLPTESAGKVLLRILNGDLWAGGIYVHSLGPLLRPWFWYSCETSNVNITVLYVWTQRIAAKSEFVNTNNCVGSALCKLSFKFILNQTFQTHNAIFSFNGQHISRVSLHVTVASLFKPGLFQLPAIHMNVWICLIDICRLL